MKATIILFEVTRSSIGSSDISRITRSRQDWFAHLRSFCGRARRAEARRQAGRPAPQGLWSMNGNAGVKRCEYLRTIHPAADRDHAAHRGHRFCGGRGVPTASRFRRCRKSISRPSRSARACRARVPETMASAVATPLERQFGRIASVTEMTSSSSLGPLDHAAVRSRTATSTRRRATCKRPSTRRAAICPTNLPSNPTYRKVNPADSPIFMIALTSDVARQGADVRRGVHHHGAEAVADSRASARWRWAAARCPACASN